MNVDTRSVAHVATQPLDSAADAYALDEDETQPLDDAGYVPYEDETQPLDSAGYPYIPSDDDETQQVADCIQQADAYTIGVANVYCASNDDAVCWKQGAVGSDAADVDSGYASEPLDVGVTFDAFAVVMGGATSHGRQSAARDRVQRTRVALQHAEEEWCKAKDALWRAEIELRHAERDFRCAERLDDVFQEDEERAVMPLQPGWRRKRCRR